MQRSRYRLAHARWLVLLAIGGCVPTGTQAAGCAGEWQVRIDPAPLFGLQRQAYADGWEPVGASGGGVVSRRCVPRGSTEPEFQRLSK